MIDFIGLFLLFPLFLPSYIYTCARVCGGCEIGRKVGTVGTAIVRLIKSAACRVPTFPVSRNRWEQVGTGARRARACVCKVAALDRDYKESRCRGQGVSIPYEWPPRDRAQGKHLVDGETPIFFLGREEFLK